METLASISYWHWMILGLVLMILEVLSFTAILLWVSAAAFITALLAYLAPDSGWQLQTLCFALSTVFLLLLTRRWMQRRDQQTEQSTLSRRGESLLGQTHVLPEPIVAGQGKINVHDTWWQIHGPDLPAGATVEITAIDNSVLIVAAADSPAR